MVKLIDLTTKDTKNHEKKIRRGSTQISPDKIRRGHNAEVKSKKKERSKIHRSPPARQFVRRGLENAPARPAGGEDEKGKLWSKAKDIGRGYTQSLLILSKEQQMHK